MNAKNCPVCEEEMKKDCNSDETEWFWQCPECGYEEDDEIIFYTFTYTFEVQRGIKPADQLDQDFYDIASTDKISRYGLIEKNKKE